MQYWICKGTPRNNDWDEMLRPGRIGHWPTARPPSALTSGDRLFFWESSPGLRLVGLGEMLDPAAGSNEAGQHLFKVRYLTDHIRGLPAITELRADPVLGDAPFLKPGPATVLTPLTADRAVHLYAVLAARAPEVAAVWPDIILGLIAPFPLAPTRSIW